MSDFPGLILTPEQDRLLVSITPVAVPPRLDPEALRTLLAEAGYADWEFAEATLLLVTESYNAGRSLADLPLGQRHDATFSIALTADAMQASISVTAARGGKALDADAVFHALDAAGVNFGVDAAAVHAVCAASAHQGCAHTVIANGQPAQNGEDARFELLVADVRDRAPQVNASGLIDFRELGAIPSVSAEQPLMRRIPPTTGSAGRNVRLEVIEPLPGRNEGFAEKLVGAYVAADDPNLLRAVYSGQPVRSHNGVNVEPVLRFRNINVATGNVTFEGTVNIDDEVLPGMKVHASGDIVVGGVVDGAELHAGGDIHIAGGVIAKARISAGGAVSARFVENSQVLAGTTIAISDSALQSDLQANNQILVGVKSSQRGRLAGGSARAMLLISAPLIGSPGSGVTTLTIGVNPVLDARYKQLMQIIDKQREEEGKLDQLVKHLTKHGDKAGMLEKAKASWQKALQAWVKLLPEKEALEREQALAAGARVVVEVGVEGAVDLTFCKHVVHLRKPLGTGILALNAEHVVFGDRLGNFTPLG